MLLSIKGNERYLFVKGNDLYIKITNIYKLENSVL